MFDVSNRLRFSFDTHTGTGESFHSQTKDQ